VPLSLQLKGVLINPIHPFLNSILSETKDIPLIGVVFYGIFVFYLLACTIKGNAKLGMRLIFMTVHPLK
jgi:LMBR1 domain-containing protein 1